MNWTTLSSLRLHACRLSQLPPPSHGHGQSICALPLCAALQRRELDLLDNHHSFAVLVQRDYFVHQLWMTRAFCILLSPMVLRAVNYVLSVVTFFVLMLSIFFIDCGWIVLWFIRGDPVLDSLKHLLRNPGNGELMLSLRGFGGS